jgi:undecaprenyl-diphosphatase
VLAGLGEYVGGQLVVWTPVLFVIALIVLAHFWRRYKALTLADRVLLWSATVPLAFFAYAATRSHGEPNWPGFAYFPLSLLTVKWLAEGWDARRVGLVRNGCIVAAVGLLAIHVPEVAAKLLPTKLRKPVMAKLDQQFGWQELGRRVGELNDGRPIVCNRHQFAGEVAFYAPGRPDVWPAADGSRPTAFDYFDGRPDFAAMPRLLFIGTHDEEFARHYEFTRTRQQDLHLPLKTGGTRHARLVFMQHGPPASQTLQGSPAGSAGAAGAGGHAKGEPR